MKNIIFEFQVFGSSKITKRIMIKNIKAFLLADKFFCHQLNQ